MAKFANKCFCCGQQIILNNAQIFENKTYCLNCYNKIIDEHLKMEQAKENLYSYIRNLFGLVECPSDIIYSIEGLLKQDKTINGIYGTIKYYFEILGHSTDNNIYFIIKIIKEQYENAKNYYKLQNQIKEKNKDVDINPPAIQIVMPPPQKNKRKPRYNMEDL